MEVPQQMPSRIPKKTVTCVFWRRGTCTRGDFCTFLHSNDGLAQTRFTEKVCRLMEACPWIHRQTAKHILFKNNRNLAQSIKAGFEYYYLCMADVPSSAERSFLLDQKDFPPLS